MNMDFSNFIKLEFNFLTDTQSQMPIHLSKYNPPDFLLLEPKTWSRSDPTQSTFFQSTECALSWVAGDEKAKGFTTIMQAIALPFLTIGHHFAEISQQKNSLKIICKSIVTPATLILKLSAALVVSIAKIVFYLLKILAGNAIKIVSDFLKNLQKILTTHFANLSETWHKKEYATSLAKGIIRTVTLPAKLLLTSAYILHKRIHKIVAYTLFNIAQIHTAPKQAIKNPILNKVCTVFTSPVLLTTRTALLSAQIINSITAAVLTASILLLESIEGQQEESGYFHKDPYEWKESSLNRIVGIIAGNQMDESAF
jgi:hypothetical protein